MVLRFRTDVDPMKEDELVDWLEYVTDKFHFIDVVQICNLLEDAITYNKYKEMHRYENKMCDKCAIVYPTVITICNKCGNDRLRSFRIHDNLKELAKNWD